MNSKWSITSEKKGRARGAFFNEHACAPCRENKKNDEETRIRGCNVIYLKQFRGSMSKARKAT